MDSKGERAAVVKWLRGKNADFHAAAKKQGARVGPLAAAYSQVADAIENGDHLPTKDQPNG